MVRINPLLLHFALQKTDGNLWQISDIDNLNLVHDSEEDEESVDEYEGNFIEYNDDVGNDYIDAEDGEEQSGEYLQLYQSFLWKTKWSNY